MDSGDADPDQVADRLGIGEYLAVLRARYRADRAAYHELRAGSPTSGGRPRRADPTTSSTCRSARTPLADEAVTPPLL